MLLMLTQFSTLASIIKLILLLIVFIGLLIAAHYFTKWYAKSGHLTSNSSNIAIIESRQVSPGKNIVIAKIGEKYVSFLMMKDNAIFLTDLNQDELSIEEKENTQMSFKDVFQNMKVMPGADNRKEKKFGNMFRGFNKKN